MSIRDHRVDEEIVTRVAADIGGTFTDIAAITNNGKLLTWKIPSTPPSFADAVSSSITELSISPFPDDRKFLLEITEDVISKGQNRGLIFAAVNDFAVKKFLKKEINFGDIYNLIRDNYDYFEKQEITTIEMLKANTTEIQKTLKLAK